MTTTQTRYSQIEKEMLAICFGLERFHQFVFGKKIIAETDNFSSTSIFKKTPNKCPARLQRMLMQIQKFDVDLVYKSGKEVPIADALSRAFSKENQYHTVLEADIQSHVCLVKSEINATPEKLRQFWIETDKNPQLQYLKKVILEG